MQVKSFLQEGQPYYHSKTEKAWNKENRVINPDAKGERMWCNGFCQDSAIYYTLEETHDASPEELAILREERRKKRKTYDTNTKKRKEERIRENEACRWEKRMDEVVQNNKNIIRSMFHYILSISSMVPTNIPEKTIILDLETTGFSELDDEILQISIIDVNENVLINTFVKPYFHTEWQDAENIHGITPDMVKAAPYLHEIISDMKAILAGTEMVIGYNSGFDIGFLHNLGFEVSGIKQYDVMEAFAPIYGEWSSYYQNFKWQSLSTCANYFDYEFKAHDALEDVRATLHCYKKINALKNSGEYDAIINRNYDSVL